jgi:VIT1/CCC1 family predicted Fe2+/Mn2+ transporter
MANVADVARYRGNWQSESDTAALYRKLAAAEPHPQLAGIYRQLAEAEEAHAAFWAEQLRAAGEPVPRSHSGWRARVLGWLGALFGARLILPMIAGLEQIDSQRYIEQTEARQATLHTQEHGHARLLRSARHALRAGLDQVVVDELDRERRSSFLGGNALRASVMGANDGLVSIFSLVMGVAGAELDNRAVLIAGMAGLLAGAISMALGEWLSVQSARELFQRQIAIERREIAESPATEEAQLARIYQAKGLPDDQACALAARMMQNPASALDTLVREEVGVDPEKLSGSAWEAGVMSFILFALGGIVPVLPYLFLSGTNAAIGSLVASAVGLFVVGAGITLMTGRNVFFSGLRQVVFGLAAAGVTFAIGRLLGISVTG